MDTTPSAAMAMSRAWAEVARGAWQSRADAEIAGSSDNIENAAAMLTVAEAWAEVARVAWEHEAAASATALAAWIAGRKAA